MTPPTPQAYRNVTIGMLASVALCTIAIPLRSPDFVSLLFWTGGIGLLISATWALALLVAQHQWGGIRQFLGVIGVAIVLAGVLVPLVSLRMSVWNGRGADVAIPDVQSTATDGVYTADIAAARVTVDRDTGMTSVSLTLYSDGRYNPRLVATVRASGSAMLTCSNTRGHLDTNHEDLFCDGSWSAATAKQVHSIEFASTHDD